MNKYICIKKFVIYFNNEPCKIFEIGEVAYIIKYKIVNYIGIYVENDLSIPMWATNNEVFKYFVNIVEWRNQQIDEILND